MTEKPREASPPEEANPLDAMRKLDKALQYGAIADLEKLFDEGMSIDQIDFEGRTALQLLSAKGNKEGVEMMLARGADVNAVFMYHGRLPKTALDAALDTNHIEIAEILKAHGAKSGKEIIPLSE